jgi:hypothetical protein
MTVLLFILFVVVAVVLFVALAVFVLTPAKKDSKKEMQQYLKHLEALGRAGERDYWSPNRDPWQ